MVARAVPLAAALLFLLLLGTPELVVVPAEVFVEVQLLLPGDDLPFQRLIDALGAEHRAFLPQPVVHVLPEQGDDRGHRLDLHGVQNGLHRNVTGHVPQRRVSVAPVEGVAEEAVEHHVQVGAVELDHVVHVLPLQVGGVVEDVHPVGGDGGGVQVHLITQTAQRQVEEAHGQVELVPGGG